MRALIFFTFVSLSSFCHGQILNITDFEQEIPGGEYIDAETDGFFLERDVIVDLTNDKGAAVDSTEATTSAGQLGWDASWINSILDSGTADGDLLGVSDYTVDVGSFPSGQQGYIIEDPDGTFRLDFASIDATPYQQLQFSASFFLTDTLWEPNDTFLFGVETDIGNFFLPENQVPTLPSEVLAPGIWQQKTLLLPEEVATASLFIEFTSDSPAEKLYIDDVVVEAIPEPAMMALFFGLLAFIAAWKHRQ